MAKWGRREFLWVAGVGAAGLVGLRLGFPYLLRPARPRALGPELQGFVDRCWSGVDRSLAWDGHVHLVGLGAGGTGCWINPEMQSHLHPIQRLQYDVYVSSIGMRDEETADADYVERLVELQRLANPAGKILLLGFDQHVDETGAERPELSPFFTPNDYVLDVAGRHEEFVPCASIHPYRLDAVERLDAAVEAGARAIKWLPNAMGIDPASPRCDPFYRRLAEHDLPLISHGGREYAVHAAEAQESGNPQHLRRALDAGVRVVVAHCASLGAVRDLDAPAESIVPAFELWLRMMEEPRWEGRLFGDISALTQLNRDVDVLKRLLEATHLHPRLVNGSDYPIPALRILFSTRLFVFEDLLSSSDREAINELATINPLLFDFALKRSLVYRKGGEEFRFADAVFETATLFRRT